MMIPAEVHHQVEDGSVKGEFRHRAASWGSRRGENMSAKSSGSLSAGGVWTSWPRATMPAAW